MNTTAGSFTLLKDGGKTVGDATVIKKLRKAGVIILGKANLQEVCEFPLSPPRSQGVCTCAQLSRLGL